jgi:hypothetical protein
MLAETGAQVVTSSEGGGSTFLGAVAAGAATVQLVRDGQVVDARSRSRLKAADPKAQDRG